MSRKRDAPKNSHSQRSLQTAEKTNPGTSKGNKENPIWGPRRLRSNTDANGCPKPKPRDSCPRPASPDRKNSRKRSPTPCPRPKKRGRPSSKACSDKKSQKSKSRSVSRSRDSCPAKKDGADGPAVKPGRPKSKISDNGCPKAKPKRDSSHSSPVRKKLRPNPCPEPGPATKKRERSKTPTCTHPRTKKSKTQKKKIKCGIRRCSDCRPRVSDSSCNIF